MKLTRETLSCLKVTDFADFNLPEKVLQFGDDDSIRGIVDWMIHRMNMKGYFEGRIVAVQPEEQGNSGKLNGQDGLYTLLTRESRKPEVLRSREIISSISRGIDPYTQFSSFLACAANPGLRIIVSNTGENGISFNAEDSPLDEPPSTFPAKATIFLLRRFMETGGDPSKGFIFLPCEPIFRNGEALRETILRYCMAWNLTPGFIRWVEESNTFLNTLMDRIVTGYPEREIDNLRTELGYEDALIDTTESYHLLVIEGDRSFGEELPFAEAGLNVIWTDNLLPYWKRKQRILNGVYTMSVYAAFLSGKNTVQECLEDETLLKFMTEGIMEEVIPSLGLQPLELREYASRVFDRFANPFISRDLLSLAAWSVTRYRLRVVPSIIEFMGRQGRLPEVLCMSLASLIAFYRGYEIRSGALIGNRDGEEYRVIDDPSVLSFFLSAWRTYIGTDQSCEELCRRILSEKALWGVDLSRHSSLVEMVAENLRSILQSGITEVFMLKEEIPA